MAKTIHRAIRALLALVLLFISLCSICGGVVFGAPANAASNVLEDLQKDESFNLDDYPDVENDYSLKVIQIAESTNRELFLYVYQPAANTKILTATCINMSLSESATESQLYNLTLLNYEGVFQKYLVKGINVSSEEIRYYNITSIYRAYNRIIDGNNTELDPNTNEIAYEVAQLWIVGNDENGKLAYSMTKTEVVTILNEYASFIRYRSGYWYVGADATDAHYVAFTADYDIERLYEAELYFVQNKTYHHYASGSGRHTYSTDSREEKHVKLTDIDKGHVKITGLGGTRHSWERIQRVDDFIKSEDASLPAESKDKIKGKQWVLRFTETSYTKNNDVIVSTNYDEFYYEISNVTILRLYFETNGIVYNLGVVNHKITEENPYKDIHGIGFNLFNWIERVTGIPAIVWKIAIYSLLLIVPLLVLSIIFPPFGRILGQALLWITKAVAWVISLPFKAIAALIRERKQAAPAKSTPSKSRNTRAPKRNSRTSRTSSASRTRTRSKAK